MAFCLRKAFTRAQRSLLRGLSEILLQFVFCQEGLLILL